MSCELVHLFASDEVPEVDGAVFGARDHVCVAPRHAALDLTQPTQHSDNQNVSPDVRTDSLLEAGAYSVAGVLVSGVALKKFAVGSVK